MDLHEPVTNDPTRLPIDLEKHAVLRKHALKKICNDLKSKRP